MTFAIDGPMLPIPSWKAIVEVNQPERLQQSDPKAGHGVEHGGAKERSVASTLTSEPIASGQAEDVHDQGDRTDDSA